MNVKPILNLEELNKMGRAEEIDIEKENKLMREIISELKKVIRKNDLTALSAPAIGYNKRIFCINIPGSEIKTFINPMPANYEGLRLTRECCTSIPGKEYIRPRNTVLDVYYQTPRGTFENKRFKDEFAFVFQHEIDHLQGITLEDIGLEIESDFDEATEDERAEIINMYLDSLDMRRQDLDNNINSDEELSRVYGAMKFREAVMRGEVEFESSEE